MKLAKDSATCHPDRNDCFTKRNNHEAEGPLLPMRLFWRPRGILPQECDSRLCAKCQRVRFFVRQELGILSAIEIFRQLPFYPMAYPQSVDGPCE